MNRREMILRTTAATIGLGLSGCSSMSGSATTKPKQVLFFTKSSGFEHSVIKEVNGQPSLAETVLTELGPKHGIQFTYSKDGSLFTPDYLDKFDAYFFYTTGSSIQAGTDKNPPMTPEGKAAFLSAIRNGKGFIGTHAASDTFHTNEQVKEDRLARYHTYGDAADDYVKMLGAEFIIHGDQQKSKMRMADPKFPGVENVTQGFELKEEWYSMKEFAKNLHVILVQETDGMTGKPYQRPAYPATWARKYGKGRVFYTSMGHRDEVWASPIFREILFGGISWAVRNVNADVTPNIETVAPGYATLPPS